MGYHWRVRNVCDVYYASGGLFAHRARQGTHHDPERYGLTCRWEYPDQTSRR